MEKAVLVLDRYHLTGIPADWEARAKEVAKSHGLEVVKIFCEPSIDVDHVLTYAKEYRVKTVIVPDAAHIQYQVAWVRTRCDLMTLIRPSYQIRQQRLVAQ